MVSRFDEYLVHQTEQPLARVASEREKKGIGIVEYLATAAVRYPVGRIAVTRIAGTPTAPLAFQGEGRFIRARFGI